MEDVEKYIDDWNNIKDKREKSHKNGEKVIMGIDQRNRLGIKKSQTTDSPNTLDNMANRKAFLKFKYAKRTGAPGSYIYWYKNPNSGKLQRGDKPEEDFDDKNKKYEDKPTLNKQEIDDWQEYSKDKNIYYHGSGDIAFVKKNGFNEDKFDENGFYGPGAYLTSSKSEAKGYALKSKTKGVGSLKVNIDKIKTFDGPGDYYNNSNYFNKKYNKQLKKEGYDAIKVKSNSNSENDWIIILDLTKVKFIE